MISNTCAQGESNNESIVLLDKHIIGIPWQSSVSNAGSTSSILGLGTKIPHLMAQEKKKKTVILPTWRKQPQLIFTSSKMYDCSIMPYIPNTIKRQKTFTLKSDPCFHIIYMVLYVDGCIQSFVNPLKSTLNSTLHYGFVCWWMHPKFCESFKKHFKQYLALELHFYLLNLGMIILIISATQTVGQGPLLSPPRVN